MKAIAVNNNMPMVFEAEIFTDILDVFIRASEIMEDDYELIQEVDEPFNNCLYTYMKQIGNKTHFKFLFKNTSILTQLQQAGMDEDEIQQKITNDCIHIIHIAEEIDLPSFAKQCNLTEIEASRSMLPECYKSNLGPDLTWIN